MNLSTTQRALLILGMVIAVAVLPLLGGLHHHHDDEIGGLCWFCTAAAAALLPLLAMVSALPPAPVPHPSIGTSAPAWFLWMARHRRGPPQSV